MTTAESDFTDTAAEWDAPFGSEGSASMIYQRLFRDRVGQVWFEITMGKERLLIRPGNLTAFARTLDADARKWQNCYWDLDLNACTSASCVVVGDSSHVGRMLLWQRMRLRHFEGAARDAEILRLDALGHSREDIALRVGWSMSTVGNVIRGARRSALV